MALYAVAIEKETKFHGAIERYANTYFYQGPAFQLGDENLKWLCDQLVAAEKLCHTSEVAFKLARIWSEGGTARENVTLGLFDQTGTGSMGAGPQLHAEAAVLVEWETDRMNVLGRKVYLRKYIRPQYLPTGGTVDMSRAKEAMTPTVRAPFKTYADTVARFLRTAGPQFDLVSPTLRTIRSVGNGQVDQFLRTREFRRN